MTTNSGADLHFELITPLLTTQLQNAEKIFLVFFSVFPDSTLARNVLGLFDFLFAGIAKITK